MDLMAPAQSVLLAGRLFQRKGAQGEKALLPGTECDVRFNEIREIGRGKSIYSFTSHQKHLKV